MAKRYIKATGVSYERPGISVTYDGENLTGDPFAVEDVQRAVAAGVPVDQAGMVAGPAMLSLDDPLLTRATLASVFEPLTGVESEGVEFEDDDAPEGAEY